MLKKIRLISKSGFFAYGLLNIGAMNSENKINEKFSKDNNFENIINLLKNEELLKEKNKKLYDILKKEHFTTCDECTNIDNYTKESRTLFEKIKELLIDKLKKLNNQEFKKYNEELLRILEKLNFENKDDIDLLNIILNGMHKGSIHNEIRTYYKNSKNNNINNFFNFFDDYLKKIGKNTIVEDIFKEIIAFYNFEKLASGCFGIAYSSDKLKSLIIKEFFEVPIGNIYKYYLKKGINKDDEKYKYIKKEEIKLDEIDTDKLEKSNADEIRHFLNIKDVELPNFCKYTLNINNKYAILSKVKMKEYKHFTKILLDNEGSFTETQSNLILLNFINLFNILNKSTLILENNNYSNKFICDRNFGNFGIDLCDKKLFNIINIDIDNFSFKKELSISIIEEFVKDLFFKFNYNIKKNVIKDEKKLNNWIISESIPFEFSFFINLCKIYENYDVDFLYSIYDKKYDKTLMYFYIEKYNSIKKNLEFYKNEIRIESSKKAREYVNSYMFDLKNFKKELFRFYMNLFNIFFYNESGKYFNNPFRILTFSSIYPKKDFFEKK